MVVIHQHGGSRPVPIIVLSRSASVSTLTADAWRSLSVLPASSAVSNLAPCAESESTVNSADALQRLFLVMTCLISFVSVTEIVLTRLNMTDGQMEVDAVPPI